MKLASAKGGGGHGRIRTDSLLLCCMCASEAPHARVAGLSRLPVHLPQCTFFILERSHAGEVAASGDGVPLIMLNGSEAVVVGPKSHDLSQRHGFKGCGPFGDFCSEPRLEINAEDLHGPSAGFSYIYDPPERISAAGDAVRDYLHAAPNPGIPHLLVNIM